MSDFIGIMAEEKAQIYKNVSLAEVDLRKTLGEITGQVV